MEGRNLKSRHAGEHIRKFRGLFWIWGGLWGDRGCLFMDLILKMTQPLVRVGATELGRFLVPPGAGNPEAPHRERRLLWALGPSRAPFPGRAWGPPGAGARDTPLLPCGARWSRAQRGRRAEGAGCGVQAWVRGHLAEPTSGGERGYRTWQRLKQFERVAKAAGCTEARPAAVL